MLRTRPTRLILLIISAAIALGVAACGDGAPSTASLRDSFAQQLAANRFITGVQRSGDDIRFTAAGADGEDAAAWRVHIDDATVEADERRDAAATFRGFVKSSWFSNDRQVTPSGADSRLPVPLTANGLAQECFALWDAGQQRWRWE